MPVLKMTLWQRWEIQGRKESGMILSLRPANERRRYRAMAYLIGWAQT